MKIFDLFDFDLTNFNHFKSRKFKLLVCSLILIISFTTIGYRTITLASVKRDDASKRVHKKIETRTFKKNVRGNIYDRNNKILATTINTLSLNINPQEILNKNETITKLIKIFPYN